MNNWLLLSNVLGLAVGAGINFYAVVLVTGLSIRFGWIAKAPGELHILAHPAVLIGAGVLYLAEFAADKVPFFTPLWDGVHTFIRPLGAALLALGATTDMPPMVKAFAILSAGTVALGMHSSKMGFRLMAHATPEPVTHAAISIAEDLGVVALLWLAYKHPWIALPLVGALLAGIVAFFPLLIRVIRFLAAGLAGRVFAWLVVQPKCEMPGTVRAYAKKARGVPRLARGWLRPQSGEFYFRRWGRQSKVRLGPLEPAVEQGVVYNTARTSKGATFYLTKEWCSCLPVE